MAMRMLGWGCVVLLLAGTLAAEEGDERLKALLKERLATVKLLAARMEAAFKAGEVTAERMIEAGEAVLKAELDLCETAKACVAVLEKLVESAKRREGLVERMVKAAAAPGTALLKAKASRLEAEIALERARPKK
ncbi:MAG: hypothetical protein K2W96_24285 [Gemmataceae bacterium]|nr:hypothetical protein [Gemmataceae bacterium]